MLIGNKCDWTDKKVRQPSQPLWFSRRTWADESVVEQVITEQQGQELADELGLRYLETSAKTNINVEEAFFALARYALCFSSLQGAPTYALK